jgi:hypothetical protein
MARVYDLRKKTRSYFKLVIIKLKLVIGIAFIYVKHREIFQNIIQSKNELQYVNEWFVGAMDDGYHSCSFTILCSWMNLVEIKLTEH